MINIKSTQYDIAKIAESGQCFRMNQYKDDSWRAIAEDKILYIKKEDTDSYSLKCTKEEYNDYWKSYFDMETDYDDFAVNVPETDKFLTDALRYSKGIRILRQNPWEMLISFIISQRRSIPAIKTSIEKLAEKFGKKITAETEKDDIYSEKGFYAFPTAEEIVKGSLDDVINCSVGYRAPYIYNAAGKVASGEINLDEWSGYDDEKLLDSLLGILGVGKKVANCVMLFGYHRLAAFPIDVWIGRMIDEHYNGSFPLERYMGYAGVIQQYIFFYGRSNRF